MGAGQSFQPLPAYPVFQRVQPKDNSALIIGMIVIVIIAIIVAIIIYAIRRKSEPTKVGRCEPGLCAVNIETGFKRCPSYYNEQIVYNLNSEVCSSKNYCQDPKLPCAVLENGALDCDGICGEGNQSCKCVAKP